MIEALGASADKPVNDHDPVPEAVGLPSKVLTPLYTLMLALLGEVPDIDVAPEQIGEVTTGGVTVVVVG